MNKLAIKVENLTKTYNLGVINYGTLYRDIQSFFARVRGKEDPNKKIGFGKLSKKLDALNKINIEIQKGEILGIIGSNGAGKSTLLKVISRITTPTEGKIGVNGRLSSLLEVGTGFHPELTGRENIYLNASINGMTRFEIDKKINEIIDFSGVKEFIDTPVKRYSSGMYVRLGFAVAANLDPDILVVDEVLAVGDAYFQSKALGKMKNLRDTDKKTILFVSHNLNSIQTLCTKVIVLSKGNVIFEGGPTEAIQKYLESKKISNRTSVNFDEMNSRKDLLENKKALKSLTLMNNKNIENNIFYVGSDMKIQIEVNKYMINQSPNIILEFVDSKGQVSLVLQPKAMMQEQFIIKKTQFYCHLKNIRLNPDLYFINLHIKHFKENMISDRIENIMNFRIIPSNDIKGLTIPRDTKFIQEGLWTNEN